MKNKNKQLKQNLAANTKKLLTRDEFNEATFKRDKHKCIFCENTKIVAHHILDRKLFEDGGYYLDNAASVCDEHHWAVEKTDISVEEVQQKCNITEPCLPPDFDPTLKYDKWGNILLENGMRKPGKMFYLENVQKILKDKLYLFEV